MLSGHHARPPLNLHTSVKESTSFIIAKFHGTASITKGRRNSQSQTLRQLFVLLFCIKQMHFRSIQGLLGKAQYAASYTLNRGPLTNNTDKEVAHNATLLPSFLAN